MTAKTPRPRSQAKPSHTTPYGWVNGHNSATTVGNQVLADGGNAIDAAVAAGLAACIAAPRSSGIAGYGGSMTLALAGGRKVVSIDFNSIAPATARPDMYPLDRHGKVRKQANVYGWRAVGVPAVLLGLEKVLKRYGTKSLREMLQPAIKLARDGVILDHHDTGALRNVATHLAADPVSARLRLKNGRVPRTGTRWRNPDLAAMLETLAADNSVESFYRGDIARRIVKAAQRGGGGLTMEDMAACRARELKPLTLQWGDFTLATTPLAAGGLSMLEALHILRHIGLDDLTKDTTRAHAWLEALRFAWNDRLTLLGDPSQVDVPVRRLLSAGYAKAAAKKIHAAVAEGRALDFPVDAQPQHGTMSVSSGDSAGNLVNITLTHGAAFGACVSVDGLGITMGHGMALFDPRPDSANAPGPRKSPLNNMCPTIMLRDGIPVLAAGVCGGRRIPNALYSLLSRMIVDGMSLEQAMDAPRLHTIGDREVEVEKTWPLAQRHYLRKLGFKVKANGVGLMNGVAFDPATGRCIGAMR